MARHYSLIVRFCFLLFFTSIQNVEAQENAFVFSNLISKGKEYLKTVRTIYQDHYGYIWIGLNAGLVRYDGYEFKIYKQDLKDSSSFLGRYVSTFTEDIYGDIWIGTQSTGLYHYMRATDSFVQYLHDPKDTSTLSHNEVLYIYPDSRGHIWCVTDSENGYIDQVNTEKQTVYRFKNKFSHLADHQNLTRIHYDPEVRMAAMLEDKNGMLWYGLKDGKGLCRYDFRSDLLKLFQHDDRISEGLRSDSVYCLANDNRDNIWIGTAKGLHRYNASSDNFDYFTDVASTTHPDRQEIYKIYKDSSGMFYFLMYSEVLQFNPDDNTFKTISVLSRDERTLFDIIGEVPRKGIWIDLSNLNYQFFDYHQEKVTTVQSILHNQSIYQLEKGFAPVSSYLIDNSGLLWIAINQKGIYKEDEFIRTFNSYSPVFEFSEGMTNTPMHYVCEDPLGKIWFSSHRGLYFFDRLKNTYYPVRPKIKGGNKPVEESLHQIVSDKQGKLWINTSTNGVLTLDSRSYYEEAGVNIVLNKPAYSSSVEFSGVESKFASDGDFTTRWSSTNSDPQWIYFDLMEKANVSRVVIYWEYASAKNYLIQTSDDRINWQTVYSVEGNARTGRVDYISVDASGRYLRIFGTERASEYGYSIWEVEIFKQGPSFNQFKFKGNLAGEIPSDSIYFIKKDSQDNIWLTSNKGLTMFDPSKQGFQTYLLTDSIDFEINNFYEDRNGILWLISDQGSVNIFNFNPLTETYSAFEILDTDISRNIQLMQKVEFYEDFEGRLWIIGKDTDNGDYRIYLYHRFTNTFELKYKYQFDITGFVQEDENLFWIALFARGLQLVDLEKGEVVKTYDNTNGLSKLEIISLNRYHSENLWLQYTDGLCSFNPYTETFHNYGYQHGIQDIIYPRTFQSTSGYIYIPAMNGFNLFHPDSISLNPDPIPPNTVITSFRIKGGEDYLFNDKLLLSDQGTRTQAIDLSLSQNVFTIGFTGFHYGLPEENTYMVLLEGHDDDWKYLGTDREVTYAGLSPGNYIFKVKSANADGIWSDTPAILPVIIRPPWDIIWWSIFASLLITFGLGYIFYRWRARIHKSHLEKKQKEIDEHRRINERLRQVDELKDQFLANTSHELRTPLSGIIGLADSLRDGVAGKQSDKAVDLLNMITASGKRLSNLINDILDFSKLKNNELKLLRKPVDVHSVADIVITILRPLVRDKSVRLSNNIPTDAPLAFADENRLQQMLINLIGNAIKFTDEGSIIVSAEQKDEFLAVSVSDTGVGIPKDKLSEIFRSFEQLDMSMSREYGGTGLGLAITKQLIDLHGGTIEVDSELGKGSTFTVFLPLSEGKISDLPELDEDTKRIQVKGLKEVIDKPIAISEEADAGSEETVHAFEGEQMNILIVDDEPVNLQVLDNYLSFAGYNVTHAKNGIVALDLLMNEKKFDLVILDVMMPKMSGYEVCNKLREKYLPNELPIIMLTVRNTVADMVCGLNCGANDYLIKPFSKEELLSRVKTHLNLHKINRIANRFVPMKFLQSIGKNSIMEVKLGDYANLEVTVFFSDIRKYTAISESMSPEDNFRFIHAYVKRMGPIIHKHSGFINQYMGDAIMAIFPEETHYSLNAAIYMQRKIGEYNKERILKGRNPIIVGMGLHCGSLTMGIIGDENRSEPSTIADTVNIAARIEQLTKYYGARILFSENSYNNLPEAHRYHIRYLGNVHVKGKKEILKVFECFDGDDDEMIKLKMKSISDFDLAVKQFYNKDFPEAAVGFKKILKNNKDDQVVINFYNHSVKFSHEGVPENWSGIEIINYDK